MQKQPRRNILTIIPSEDIEMGESVIGFLISCLHFYHCLILHTDNMIKPLTDLIYDFLLDGKPDKVSRKQICKEYLKGGL